MATLQANVLNGQALLGQLTGRGAFDQYGAYQPGDVAIDGSDAYINLLPVGGALLGADSFVRPNADRWGLTSGGQEWNSYRQAGDNWGAAIRTNQGILLGATTSVIGAVLLLDQYTTDNNRDVIARIALDPTDLANNITANLFVWADTDLQNAAALQFSRNADETLNAVIGHYAAGAWTADATDAALNVGGATDVFARVRYTGTSLSARIWAATAPEPTSFALTHTVAFVSGCQRVGLGANLGSNLYTLGVKAFSARALASSTAPSSDTVNWQSLVTAFPLTAPR